MYAIIGATGHIGSRIADLLLEKGVKVRGISRDERHLASFVKRGGEPAVGDLRDGAFLAKTFRGAEAVFAMIPPNIKAADLRADQNEIGASIAGALREAGVKWVVNLSSQGADLPSGSGPILGLRDQEERLNRLEGVNVLHLRPSYFMENLLMNIPLINEQGIAGSAVRGDLPFAMIACSDIADRAAERLLGRDFSGKQVEDLLGERDLSLNEAISVLGRRIGKPDLRYVQFPSDEAEKGLVAMGVGEDAARLFIEMSQALNEGRFAVTKNPADKGAFKTPSLYNSGSLAFYMHDGAFSKLSQVVAHYNQGGNPKDPNQSKLIFPLKLSAKEQSDLVAFLDSLTDKRLDAIGKPADLP